jgi:hypothetical protein
MELQAIEFVLQLSDLRTVSIHLFTGIVPVLGHLVYDKSRITKYHEPFYAELNGDAKAMQRCLILSGVIGGLEVDMEDIAPPVPRWRDEVHPYPGTIDIEGAVKIHLPMLGGAVGDGCIHIYPFDNEVDQRL